jgi:hypothetical protein
MAKRKSLSKKIRFEILKRDSFTCQYCGARAPDVLLQVDHIASVASGGLNEPLNLITSCAACNGGKGARALSDDAVLSKRRTQLEELQARREQIALMLEWQKTLVDLEGTAADGVAAIYSRLVPGWSLNEAGLAMARALVAQHGLPAVVEELRTSTARYVRIVEGRATDESVEILIGTWKRALQWRASRQRDPVGQDLKYIRGIIRNRCSYCPEEHVMLLLRRAVAAGVSVEALKESALDARVFTSWEYRVSDMIAAATGGSNA